MLSTKTTATVAVNVFTVRAFFLLFMESWIEHAWKIFSVCKKKHEAISYLSVEIISIIFFDHFILFWSFEFEILRKFFKLEGMAVKVEYFRWFGFSYRCRFLDFSLISFCLFCTILFSLMEYVQAHNNDWICPISSENSGDLLI